MTLEVRGSTEEVDPVTMEVRGGTEEVDLVIMEVREGREEVDPVMGGQRGAARRWTLSQWR